MAKNVNKYAKIIIFHNSLYMAELAPIFERVIFENEIKEEFIKNNKSNIKIEEIYVLYSGGAEEW